MRIIHRNILCLSLVLTVLVGLCILSTSVNATTTPQIIYKISGCAYEDLNCNGRLDPGEPRLDGGKFKLYRYLYLFKKWLYVGECCGSCYDAVVLLGTHRVVYEPPAGYKPSNALPGDCGSRIDASTLEICQIIGCCRNNNFLACRDQVTRQCFVPITFTPHQWAKFCCPFRPTSAPASVGNESNNSVCIGNPLIPEGLVYSRFPIAFECFRFFGEKFPNQLVLGDEDARITFIGKTSCLENLCHLLGSDCYGCGPILISKDCPDRATEEIGGCLLQETIALLMNVAYNDMRLMPKTPGVDLECYTLAEGPLRGKTVGQVLFIANEVLSGRPPQMFGLIDCEQLVEVIHNINANYKFYDFNTTTDRGYLIPNKPFGQPEPPHCPELKDYAAECVIGPCVKVVKTVCPLIARVGQDVTYKYKICNCGPEQITVDAVDDSEFGGLLAEFLFANGGSAILEPQQCVEFSLNTTVPDTDAQSVTNEVTVEATGEGDVIVEDTDRATVGILRDNPDRTIYLPTTFTKEGWAFFCDPANEIINGGMIYNRFHLAFKCFEFYGETRPSQLLVGSPMVNIRYVGKTDCLRRLCMLLQADCQGCGKLRIPVDCPWRLTSTEGGGCLAVETIVLLMNVAYNDMRLMPRTKGVDLECYKLASGPLKGKTVAEVFNIANELLQGKPPCMFKLASCEQLVEILRQINANYEFVDFDTYIDRGFLIPHEPFNPLAPPHCPQVPMVCGPVG